MHLAPWLNLSGVVCLAKVTDFSAMNQAIQPNDQARSQDFLGIVSLLLMMEAPSLGTSEEI